MTLWLVAALLGVTASALAYVPLRAPSPVIRFALAAMRGVALAILVALLLNAPLGRPAAQKPSLFIDASSSMTRGGSKLWQAAWDSARRVDADSTWAFGDTVRRANSTDSPADASSRIRAVVERSLSTGRPVVVITDGELQDTAALDGLTTGSRMIVLPRAPQQDVAVVAMDAPRAAVEGDSLTVRVTFAAGSSGSPAGAVTLMLEQQTLGRWPIQPMSPASDRQMELRVRAAAVQGPGVLRAIVTAPGDVEPRNDTLAATMEISRAASAVFVSTSPDQDARFAIAVLRGTLALPTRGFLRVAPGNWRREGTLEPVTEAEVRRAVREAPVAIIHGDSAIFGPPASAAFGPLALLVPPDVDDGEWYPVAAPMSPLSGALAAIPLDSLPPIVTGQPAAGEWTALEARRGRESTRRPVIVGRDTPRRIVTVTGSGFWRWRFRGGVSADAFAALWGGIFDWLAAERADRRAAVPDENVVRAGQVIRWRRGSSTDSVVRVVLQPRGTSATRPDTMVLRFPSGVATQESAPLSPGIYDVFVPGGRTALVVNQSAELLPARPGLRSGAVGGRRTVLDDARRARNAGWLYALVIVLLCAEWIARRRAGLR